tara:strand:+ start:15678 stop:16925 length:1248 start_codon:yes stop_codon:yes gene_type:complete
MKIIKNHLLFIFISTLPLTIIVGPSVSLTAILLTAIILILILLKFEVSKIYTNKVCVALFALYIYLIFNTLISIDPFSGIYRNLGFLRFLLLFLAINYFFYAKSNADNIFIFWSIIFSIFVFDVFVERFSGANILGFKAQSVHEESFTRVVSFFKDEAIAGAFLNGFLFIVVGYFFTVSKKKNYPIFISILFFILCLVAILITGERSNTIKAFFGFVIFLFFLDFLKLKIKISLLFILSGLIIIIILSYDYLKLRYKGQFYDFINSKEIREKTFENNIYIKLYKSGFRVFKDKPLFGVGNKNYRIETCKQNYKYPEYICSTHPHQVYIELLAEHGALGFILILYIIFFLIFRILKQIIMSKNYIQIGSFIYLIINFIPLLPSGSFFSDFNLTLFMINFSIMYAVNKKTNIFYFKN